MIKVNIISPEELKKQLPVSQQAIDNIAKNRLIIKNIIDRKDSRFLMIVGPCSFHDHKACFEYASKLKELANFVSDKIFIVMRVYLEKARTAMGWKGYISDPYRDDTFNMEDGIRNARSFMLQCGEVDLPLGSEILNPLVSKYIEDLIGWAAIGARTSESQLHREIASSLSIPIGFKNSSSGNIKTAINSILVASRKQAYLDVNSDGLFIVTHSLGNNYGHIVMRGGDHGPNYASAHIKKAEQAMGELNIPNNIIIDCSHGNSGKDYLLQEAVLDDIIAQKKEGNKSIIGIMLESFLENGNQSDFSNLRYGCSITDSCMGWEDTERVIKAAYRHF